MPEDTTGPGRLAETGCEGNGHLLPRTILHRRAVGCAWMGHRHEASL